MRAQLTIYSPVAHRLQYPTEISSTSRTRDEPLVRWSCSFAVNPRFHRLTVIPDPFSSNHRVMGHIQELSQRLSWIFILLLFFGFVFFSNNLVPHRTHMSFKPAAQPPASASKHDLQRKISQKQSFLNKSVKRRSGLCKRIISGDTQAIEEVSYMLSDRLYSLHIRRRCVSFPFEWVG